MSNDTIVALLVAVLGGGVGVKLVEGLFAMRPQQAQTDSQRIDALWKRVDALEAEVTEWKGKYFDLLGKYNTLETQYQDVCEQLEALQKRAARRDAEVK